MPVYNTVLYVRESVEAILSQTLEEFEFIIIDDGSNDGSSDILKEYEAKDSRIRLITKINEGSSIARSIGIAYATGEYLYFMDSDDLIKAEALEECYRHAKENKLDFLLFDAISFSQETGERVSDFSYNKKGEFSTQPMSGVEMLEQLMERGLYRVTPWIHLINREFVLSKNLDFYPGIINEDELFITLMYLHAKRCAYFPKLYFKRRLREGSIMTVPFSGKRSNSYMIITRELKRASETLPALTEPLLNKILTNIVNGVAEQSEGLSSRNRTILINELRDQNLLSLLSLKHRVILFCPWLKRGYSSIKQKIKR